MSFGCVFNERIIKCVLLCNGAFSLDTFPSGSLLNSFSFLFTSLVIMELKTIKICVNKTVSRAVYRNLRIVSVDTRTIIFCSWKIKILLK